MNEKTIIAGMVVGTGALAVEAAKAPDFFILLGLVVCIALTGHVAAQLLIGGEGKK